MKRTSPILLLLVTVVLALFLTDGNSQAARATVRARHTTHSTPSPVGLTGLLGFTPLGTATASPTSTSTPTSTPTDTPTPTDTSTPVPTSTPTSTPTSSANISLDPSSVTAGVDSSFSVSGSGFSPNEQVSISYTVNLVEGGSTTESTTSTTDSSGSFSSAQLTVPSDAAAGTYAVTATGQSSALSASADLTVNQASTVTVTPTVTPTSTATPTLTPTPASTPVITLSPSSVSAGINTTVSVSGSGFSSDETVVISYQPSLTEGGTTLEQTTAVTLSDGTFVASNLGVPSDAAAGSYVVTATGQSSGLSASADLTVSGAAPTNTAVSTNTPTPTPAPPTSTPTDTPVPTAASQSAPAISIVKVAVLHRVNGREVATQSLRLREQAEFVVAFHTVHAAGLKTTGVLLVTKGGKRVSGHTMDKTRYDGHRAFVWRITFYKASRIGTLYAHFTVSAGSASAKRDRRFTLRLR